MVLELVTVAARYSVFIRAFGRLLLGAVGLVPRDGVEGAVDTLGFVVLHQNVCVEVVAGFVDALLRLASVLRC